MSQTCMVLGRTLKERTDALETASKAVRAANWLATGLFVWSVAFPRPYAVVLWSLIAMPFAALAGSFASRVSIRFGATPGEPNPAIGGVIAVSALALGIRAFFDWDAILVARFWTMLLLVALPLFVLIFMSFVDIRNQPARALGVMVLCLVFGYGLTVTANSHYDRSRPILHEVQVLQKSRARGKLFVKRYDRYHLKISRWEQVARPVRVSVDKAVYEAVNFGDRMVVEHRPGALGIPWYSVRQPRVGDVVTARETRGGR